MIQQGQQDSQERRNLRVGLIVASVALVLFFGSILRFWLLGR